jgi:hypothetical protein
MNGGNRITLIIRQGIDEWGDEYVLQQFDREVRESRIGFDLNWGISIIWP